MLKEFFIFLIYLLFSDSAPYDASSDASDLLGPDCASDEELMKFTKCLPLLEEYNNKTSIMNDTDIELNDTRLTGFITLCKKTMMCLEPTCLSEKIKDEVYARFLLAEVKNTELANCAMKIEKKKPDLSVYDCLKSEDYTNGVIATSVLESKPDCLQTVFNGYCGEAATVNFDENVSKLISAIAINSRLNGTNSNGTTR
ncbi:unnamed protein product [Caenorhabditis brenneri]